MATYEENLVTIRDNIAASLATASASPKPNYTIEGQTVSYADYFAMLMAQLKAANQAIAAGTPFEIVTEIY
jgi:hypothetical protein